MLVVGEAHGVRETAEVVGMLMRELDARALALEWSYEEVDEPLQRFLRDGVLDFSALPPTAEVFQGDGRATEELVRLLHALRDEGRLEQLIAFDRLDPEPPPADWRVRDAELAERLLAGWDRRLRVVVLTGGFHAQLAPGTMADHLARELPGLQPAMLAYRGVELPVAPIVFELPAPTPATPLRR